MEKGQQVEGQLSCGRRERARAAVWSSAHPELSLRWEGRLDSCSPILTLTNRVSARMKWHLQVSGGPRSRCC